MAEAGFKINGKFYPMPSSMRLGEASTIKRISGYNPSDFVTANDDPDVLRALVWWAVHREDPAFTIEMVDELEFSQIEGSGVDEESDPKAEGEPNGNSPTSAEASNGNPGAPGATIPVNGGDQDSVLSVPVT